MKVTRDVIRINAVKHGPEKRCRLHQASDLQRADACQPGESRRDLKEPTGKDLKGYIIDLRNNPGGLFDQAIAVSDDMLDRA